MENFTAMTDKREQLFEQLPHTLYRPVVRMLCQLIVCLQEGCPAHLSALADNLPDTLYEGETEEPSARKIERVRYFLSNPNIWFCPSISSCC